MSHNASKVLMGTTGSSEKEVTNIAGSVSTFEAGVAVRLKSDGTPSLAQADGELLGISLGRSLSDIDRIAVCRKGIRVPIKLTSGFNPTVGAAVAISDTTGLAKAYTGTGDRYVNAVYSSGRVGGSGATAGIAEGATTDTGTVGVAYIDFPGGL